jgi:hypothetical protein
MIRHRTGSVAKIVAQTQNCDSVLVQTRYLRAFQRFPPWLKCFEIGFRNTTKFYEALGGTVVAEQQIERGGQWFTESATVGKI